MKSGNAWKQTIHFSTDTKQGTFFTATVFKCHLLDPEKYDPSLQL